MKLRSGNRNALSEMTADYLQQLHISPEDGGVKYQPDPDGALLSIFSEKNVGLLRARGYDVQDVLTWAWVLTSRTADEAATKISLLSSGAGQPARGVLPMFVILQVLRAPVIGAECLRDLFDTVQSTILPSGNLDLEDNRRPAVSEQTAVVLVVRMLRHARRVAPALLDKIASMTCTLLISGKTGHNAIMEPAKTQRLCYIHNRVLSLLALPTSAAPYRAVPIQQRAQFRVLRRMMEFKPQLPVTREGYRALVKLQIAHRKMDPRTKMGFGQSNFLAALAKGQARNRPRRGSLWTKEPCQRNSFATESGRLYTSAV